jgi:HSP20 family protein
VEKRRDIHQAASEIEELFSDLWQVFPFTRGLHRGYRPQVDVVRTDDPPTVSIFIELPGIDPKAVKLVAAPRGVIISGERQRPKNYGHIEQMEIEYGPFQRQVLLNEDVDPESATATYERGVLRVSLPVAPKPAPQTQSVSIEVRLTR